MTAKIIRLYPNITSDIDQTGSESARAINEPTISTSVNDQPLKHVGTSIKDLYPLRAELNPELATALQLMEEGIQYLNVAVDMLIEDDLLSSDDSLQKFQALLPELFCCRDLGEGFGAIVNSIFHALKNLGGIPLNLEQLKMIRNIVKRISTEPFIEFEEALDEIINLENFGLSVEPEYFKFAADMLNE